MSKVFVRKFSESDPFVGAEAEFAVVVEGRVHGFDGELRRELGHIKLPGALLCVAAQVADDLL